MSTQNYLYRHFDKNGQLLYVGISLNAVSRTYRHKTNSWFNNIANITIVPVGNRYLAHKIEREIIQKEKPLHNTALQKIIPERILTPKQERRLLVNRFRKEGRKNNKEMSRKTNIPYSTVLKMANDSDRAVSKRTLSRIKEYFAEQDKPPTPPI